MEAVPLNNIMGQPTLNYVHHLSEQLATTKWSGKLLGKVMHGVQGGLPNDFVEWDDFHPPSRNFW